MRFYKGAKDAYEAVVQIHHIFTLHTQFLLFWDNELRAYFKETGFNEFISEYFRVAMIIHKVWDDIQNFLRPFFNILN